MGVERDEEEDDLAAIRAQASIERASSEHPAIKDDCDSATTSIQEGRLPIPDQADEASE